MITPKQLEEKAAKKWCDLQLARAEEILDARLEAEWDGTLTQTIQVCFNFKIDDQPVHRSVLDELVRRYDGPDKWDVELRSSKNNTIYDTLKLKKYTPARTFPDR